MNVTNIFAGDKVREKKKTLTRPCLKTILWPGGVLGEDVEESTGQPGGRREALRVLPGAVRQRTGARSPAGAPSSGGGLPGWSSPPPLPSTGVLTLPHPSPPPANAASAGRGGEGEAGMGSVRLSSIQGFSSFSERKRGTSSFALERCVTVSQTPTRAYRTASRARV